MIWPVMNYSLIVIRYYYDCCFFASPVAITMFIAILVTCHVFQPIGFMLAIIIAFLGFFMPMTRHRIPHEAGWQNPVMLGGLIMGVCNTVICYSFAIWPHILVHNAMITCKICSVIIDMQHYMCNVICMYLSYLGLSSLIHS